MTLRLAIPGLLLTAAIFCAPRLHAQAAAQPAGVMVDQVVAVVNGDLVLESDVDEERRFVRFQPLQDPGEKFSRDDAVKRLIDRELILQQSRLQPDDKVTLAEAQAQLQSLRKDIPNCHCATDATWQKFVATQGFTVAQLEERWRERMEILKFIEVRFRAGIRIEPSQIKTYYDKTLVPEERRANVTPPALDVTISDQIQQILLEQQVNALLEDWLTSLKAQGTVRMMKPGEEVP